MGGATSIDVTKPALTKRTESENWGTTWHFNKRDDIHRDALFPGGNDYPAEEAGVVSIPVKGPEETKRVTEAIIACLDNDQKSYLMKRVFPEWI